jgi:hypothetical protein
MASVLQEHCLEPSHLVQCSAALLSMPGWRCRQCFNIPSMFVFLKPLNVLSRNIEVQQQPGLSDHDNDILMSSFQAKCLVSSIQITFSFCTEYT